MIIPPDKREIDARLRAQVAAMTEADRRANLLDMVYFPPDNNYEATLVQAKLLFGSDVTLDEGLGKDWMDTLEMIDADAVPD